MNIVIIIISSSSSSNNSSSCGFSRPESTQMRRGLRDIRSRAVTDV